MTPDEATRALAFAAAVKNLDASLQADASAIERDDEQMRQDVAAIEEIEARWTGTKTLGFLLEQMPRDIAVVIAIAKRYIERG